MSMLSRRNRIVLSLVVALSMLLSLAGCTSGTGDAGKKKGTPVVSDEIIWLPGEFDRSDGMPDGAHCIFVDLAGNKTGVVDYKGELIAVLYDGFLGLNYSYSDKFSDGPIVVDIDGEEVWMDAWGSILAPEYDEYSHINPFIEDRARVDAITGKSGYVDTDGKIVIPIEYTGAGHFYEGLACVGKDGKYGFIDTDGKIVVPFEFDDGFYFSEGLALMKKGGKYGFIDTDGKTVISFEYDDANPFLEGFAAVAKDNKWGVIDTTGKVVVPLQYRNLRLQGSGFVRVSTDDESYEEFNLYFDYSSKYDNLWDFSEGLAKVVKDHKFGYVDIDGKEIISPQYDDARDFSEGLAAVEKAGMWGFVDNKGKTIIPFEYDGVYYSKGFVGGLAAVRRGWYWGFIDTKGTVVVPFEWDDAYPINDGEILIVQKGDTYGFYTVTYK